MGVLVLHYTVNDDCVGLQPRLLEAGKPEQPWRAYPHLEYHEHGRSVLCEVKSLVALSKDIHRALAGAAAAMCDAAGNLDHGAARGHLEELRRLGTELRRRLLPKDVSDELRRQWSIQDIVFECEPSLSSVPFDLMFLWDDFLGYRFGTGRRLLTPTLPGPSQNPPPRGDAGGTDLPCRGFSLVDPENILQHQGAKRLRAEFERFRDGWETLSDERGRPAREMIDFAKTRAFRPVRKADVKEDAFWQHRMVNLICHHVFDRQCPERSGFVLGAMPGKPAEVFTAVDLADCLGSGTTAPWVILAIACRSGTLEGWDSEWMQVDRLYGMVDAAIRAGVHHYLGAIVKIPADRSPGLLFPFYQALIQGKTVGQAVLAARRSFRETPTDPLDAGTALGLAFVLYGDPTVGYFCRQGHLVHGVPQVTCEAMEPEGSRCGRVVCQRDDSFGRFRCARHGEAGLKCSAGHEVEHQEELTRCRFAGYPCQNSVCPECPGYGQGLCWEHCCCEDHPIAGGTPAKRCTDPTGNHRGEKRSVCPQDPGWMRGLCRDCLAVVSQTPAFCPHCGTFIGDGNPWSSHICECCGQNHCTACESWYLATLYCRYSQNLSQEARDNSWVDRLEKRGKGDPQLATPAALRPKLAMSTAFQEGVAANLKECECVRWYKPLPRLYSRPLDVILWEPRCWRGLCLDVADLNEQLKGRLTHAWKLRQDPPWEPPKRWADLYFAANQLRVHWVRGLAGAPVIVAIATLVPVAFESGRGPVLTPSSQEHIDLVKGVLEEWWRNKSKGRSELPDTYLVVLSVTGWLDDLEAYAQYGARVLTVVAAPKGQDFRVVPPPLVGKPDRVRDFVRCLQPKSASERLARLVQWMKDAMKTRTYLSAADVQDELERQGGDSLDVREILAAFQWLEREGYERPDADKIRPLPRATMVAQQIARRRWQSRLYWTVMVAGAALSMVSCFWERLGPRGTGIGLGMAVGAWALNTVSKLIASWRHE